MDSITIEIPEESNENELNGKSVCFLIASGFSVPYGFATVGTINDMFVNLKIDDFIILPDRHVMFSNGQEDPNGWMNINQRHFFVEFIAHYYNNLPEGKNFHYEDFYDYYYSRYRGEDNDVIDDFCQSFRQKHNIEDNGLNNTVNLLLSFNNIFTQLLASKLTRRKLYENGVHYGNYHPYDNFISYLNYLVDEGYVIHLFTLNHDILLDHICSHTGLWEYYSDGYNDLGSPFYGDLTNKENVDGKPDIEEITTVYKVRSKTFTNKFENQIRLYKLHGSIDTHIMGIKGFDRPRIKNLFGVHDYFVEKKNELDELVYERSMGNTFPDFLSGTTEKLRSYGDAYYSQLFEHLERELPTCEKLAVIGYGFWDSGINKFLQEGIIDQGIDVSVIDPYEPRGPLYVSNKKSISHYEKDLKDVTVEEFKEIVI